MGFLDYNGLKRFYTKIKDKFSFQQNQINNIVNGNNKNLIRHLIHTVGETTVSNGISFTLNSDYSITCNGTATGTSTYIILTIRNEYLNQFIGRTLTLSGCPKNSSSNNAYRLQLYVQRSNGPKYDRGDGVTFTLTEEDISVDHNIAIVITEGTVCDNLIFYPMLYDNSIWDSTYVPPAMSVIELTNRIGKYYDNIRIDRGNKTSFTFYLEESNSNYFKYAILVGGGSSVNPQLLFMYMLFFDVDDTCTMFKILGESNETISCLVEDKTLTISSDKIIYGGVRLIWLT